MPAAIGSNPRGKGSDAQESQAVDGGLKIGHLEADVVQTLAATFDEPGDRRFRTDRLEQLHTARIVPEEDHFDAFGRNCFTALRVLSEQGREGRYGSLQGIDRDAYVVDLEHFVLWYEGTGDRILGRLHTRKLG